MLLAALMFAFVGFDAEAGPASGTRGLTGGAGGFLLIMEELHQQVKLGIAVSSLNTRAGGRNRSCRKH